MYGIDMLVKCQQNTHHIKRAILDQIIKVIPIFSYIRRIDI